MKHKLRTPKEILEERAKLEGLSERWPDLRLAIWLIYWLLHDGPSPSSTLELLEEKAHDMLTEEYLAEINRCQEERPEQGRSSAESGRKRTGPSARHSG